MKKKVLALFLILLVVTIVLAAGCGSEKVTVKDNEGNDITVSSDDNKLEIKGDQGQLSVSTGSESVKLPEGYPQDLVPIFPGAQIQMAMKTDESISVHLNTEKGLTEVYNYYLEVMKNAEELNQNQNNMLFNMEGIKGEYRIFLSGMNNEIDGKKMTVVNIVLEPEQ